MRQVLLILVAIAGLAATIDAFMVEPYRIEVTHSSVQASLTRPLKIAHLSDLHTSGLGRREQHLLDLLDAEQPDVGKRNRIELLLFKNKTVRGIDGVDQRSLFHSNRLAHLADFQSRADAGSAVCPAPGSTVHRD